MLALLLELLLLLISFMLLLLLLWRLAPAMLKNGCGHTTAIQGRVIRMHLAGWMELIDCFCLPPLLEGMADEEEPKYVALDGRDVAMPLPLPLPPARDSTAPGAELK